MFLTKISDYISGLIRSMGITDLIDIAIIAVFIYLILVWLKRARARFTVIGIVILGSIYAVARFFHLYLTTTFFQAFLAIFLIMIVVIFQDEFRHFFEAVAVKGMVRKPRRKTPFSQEIESITNAVAKLSRKKFGALIAIRGIDPLDRYLEAGFSLDGLLNQLLLESIFDPHVPTHDGAVVIDRERIIRVGCHLPLSTNIEKVSGLGTRHTAALGLSERTDALCIIVSEERGTVSVAEDGNIRQLTDVSQLNNILESFYRKRFPVKRSSVILDFLKGHSLEKLIAVVFAVCLWLALGERTEMVRRDFTVPIEYRNLAPDIFIGEPKPKEVTLTLNGSERAFKLIDPNNLKLSPDMGGIHKDGENYLLLNKDMIRLPAGVSIVHFYPEEIKLMIYRMFTLALPVEVKTQGRPGAGITINQIKVEPKEISVIVPSTTSRGKFNIVTEPIDLSSIDKTTTLTPKLIIPPDARFPLDKYPEIKVTVEVENKRKAR
ncbi:MAG: diadenylate cyclase [Candidatus Omnitrophica bacterium]|nr:diadenylate cyclase [Candidatus Omnitrophota bacterium]MDD5610630.1 diadenylate cyclase [Candidatus Omnitrophota bacterium]